MLLVPTPVQDWQIPAGARIFFCEQRGYDSPERWYRIELMNGAAFDLPTRNLETAIEAARTLVNPYRLIALLEGFA